MDTKNPINLTPQNRSCIHVIVDAFNLFVVTVPIESNNAKTAVTTLLHHWIAKYGPSVYLVTDRGLIMIWQIYVLSWVVDILLEHLTPLGLKDIATTLEHTTPTDWHNKFKGTLLYILHNLFQH